MLSVARHVECSETSPGWEVHRRYAPLDDGDGALLDGGDDAPLDDGDGALLDGGDDAPLDDGDGALLDGGDDAPLGGDALAQPCLFFCQHVLALVVW